MERGFDALAEAVVVKAGAEEPGPRSSLSKDYTGSLQPHPPAPAAQACMSLHEYVAGITLCPVLESNL